MIPRLHAFYGPADQEYGSWWRVPQRFMRIYATMLPRLEAEGEAREVRAAGSAWAEQQDRSKYLRELEEQKVGRENVRKQRRQKGNLGVMGIAVKEV